jgi:hypothetical protein
LIGLEFVFLHPSNSDNGFPSNSASACAARIERRGSSGVTAAE